MDTPRTETGRDPGESLVLVLSGTPAHGDDAALEVLLAERVPDTWHRPVVLDCAGLGGLSEDMARVLGRWWRRLADRGGTLRIRGANVVVHWVLERTLGTAAAAAMLGAMPVRDGAGAAARDAAGPAVRPRRDLAVDLQQSLAAAADPGAVETAVTTVLREAGLARDVRLVQCRRGRLISPRLERDDVPADGWLGSLLAAAGCPVSVAELRRTDLSREEAALLLWAGADMVVPLVGDDGLMGLLLVATGREATGWAGWTSGEVLALDLVGRILAAHLPAVSAPDVSRAAAATDRRLVTV